MIKKVRVWLLALAVVLTGMVGLQRGVALADCHITGSSGDDDVVACSNPADTDGIATGNGNDTITVEIDTEVHTTDNVTAIDAGFGDDKVYLYGLVTSPSQTDTIDMRGGSDLFENYGRIDSGDDGVWCAPATGNTCTIRNFGTIYSTNESIDVYGKGGNVVISNSGSIESLLQEGMHLLSEVNTLYMVTNSGTIEGRRNGVEVGWGRLSMSNSGTIISQVEVGVKTGGHADWLNNTGSIQTNGDPALELGPSTDVLLNSGTISASNTTSDYESAVAMEAGRDEVTNSGDIIITGKGLYSIEAGTGSDTVTIKGGTINKLIYGDDHEGSDAADYDILVFEFTGDAGAVQAFRDEVNAQTPQSGSATWNGKLYQWAGFEEIRLNMSGNGVPTSTPAPTNTNTPKPTNTPVPTGTAQPTSTAQPTNTPKPTNTAVPTSTGQPTNTPVPSDAPALNSPSDGVVSDKNRFRLVWSSVSGAKSYELQVATSTAFSNIAVAASTGGTKKSIKLSDVGWHYWRVRAVYSDGGKGPWSQVRSVGYGVQPQGGAPAPGLLSPANGAILSKSKANLTWGEVAGAMQYQVQVATSSSFNNPITDATSTKMKLKVKLDAAGTYYWRVRAQYRDGSAGAWSAPYTMTYDAQASTGLDVPTAYGGSAQGSLLYGALPRMEWGWVLGLIF